MTWLIKHFEKLGDRSAIVDTHGEFTYSQLLLLINEYFAEIESALKPGDVVALQADYNYFSIAAIIALVKRKIIIVPIVSKNEQEVTSRLKVANCDWILNLADKKLIFIKLNTSSEKHILIKKLIDQKNTGLVLFSSGSTGEPKAMIHNMDHLVDSFIEKKSKHLNMLVFLMFDHIGGLNTLLNTLSMGARIILPSSRNPEYIASLIELHKVNVLPTTPTFLNMMLMAKVQDKFDLNSLKMITYGTEPMPESLLHKIREAFPRARLMQTFGTSETGIAQTTSRSSHSLEMRLDDQNTEYKIVNNELWLRSKTQVMGYLNADMSNFTEDGWFKTGDLVESTEDGYIKIIGRSKEVINVGGEKVLPAEVESIVLELDIVNDCTVFAEKNAITGQMVAIRVVLIPGYNEKDAKKAIRSYCREKLDAYKVPAKFIFSESTAFSERFKKQRLK